MEADNRYESIIASIASVAAYQVQGIASLSNESGKSKLFKGASKGVMVTTLGAGQVTIDINVNAYYGFKVPDLAYDLQNKIKEEVEKATNYKVKSINVSVVGVVFPS